MSLVGGTASEIVHYAAMGIENGKEKLCEPFFAACVRSVGCEDTIRFVGSFIRSVVV